MFNAKMMTKIVVGSSMLAIALGGCSYGDAALGFAEGKVEQAINLKQRQSDLEAKAAIRVPCIITVGAARRVLTEEERSALSTLCGPSTSGSQALKKLMKARDQ